jgi:hypothetical protein
MRRILSPPALEWLDLDHHRRVGAQLTAACRLKPFMLADSAKRNGRWRRAA